MFFNPKFGITYTNRNLKMYLSYAKATKEPNRDDFETSSNNLPKPETLHDIELGVEKKNKTFAE
jgi:iron complex outermembrane receptor protein